MPLTSRPLLRPLLLGAVLLAAPSLTAAPFSLQDPTLWASGAGGNDNYYQVFDQGDFITWADAEFFANSIGGRLATIGDSDENDFITALTLTPLGYLESWIGLTDMLVEGDFRWITGEAVTFLNWATGEPNDDPSFNGEDFAIINPPPEPAGTWNDLPNDPRRVRGFVVEFNDLPPAAVPEPTTLWTLAAGAALLLLRRRRGGRQL